MKTDEKINNLSEEEQTKLIMELRDRTNMGMLYCKYALKKYDWNIENAQLFLKENSWKLL